LGANVYEGMYILDSNRFGRDSEAVSSQVTTMIEKQGGEILVSRLWEERRLAFPIKGHRKGTYWLTYFRLDATKLGDLKRQCQITEDIIRVLFLKVDPRIVDALVTHAKTAPAVVAPVVDEAKPIVEGLDEEALPIVDALEGEVIEVEDDK
jgi:small subunit ribosomal protein S6